MNGDLISREAVWELLNMEHPMGFNNDDIAEAFRNAPAVDAEPVRHGRWILYDVREYADELQIPEYKCSICGRIDVTKEPYCHCGAKMDGDNDA